MLLYCFRRYFVGHSYIIVLISVTANVALESHRYQYYYSRHIRIIDFEQVDSLKIII